MPSHLELTWSRSWKMNLLFFVQKVYWLCLFTPVSKGIFVISLCMLYSGSHFRFCLLPYSSLGFVFIFSKVMLSPCGNWLTQKRAGWIIHYVWFNQRIYVSFCFIKCLQIYQSFLSAICFCEVILPNNCNKYSFVLKVKHSLCKNLTWVSNTITMPVETKGKVVMGWFGWIFWALISSFLPTPHLTNQKRIGLLWK